MPASTGSNSGNSDIELVATVKAAHLRFRTVPSVEVRFSGIPDHESATSSRRRNLPDPVTADVDYHDVRVDYRLTNRLRAGNPGTPGSAPTAFLDRGDPAT